MNWIRENVGWIFPVSVFVMVVMAWCLFFRWLMWGDYKSEMVQRPAIPPTPVLPRKGMVDSYEMARSCAGNAYALAMNEFMMNCDLGKYINVDELKKVVEQSMKENIGRKVSGNPAFDDIVLRQGENEKGQDMGRVPRSIDDMMNELGEDYRVEYQPKQKKKFEPKPSVNELITRADLPKMLQPYHWRHLFSGAITYALSIGTGLFLGEVHHRWPREVHWMDGTVSKGYKRGFEKLPELGQAVQIGVMDDGNAVWRIAPATFKVEAVESPKVHIPDGDERRAIYFENWRKVLNEKGAQAALEYTDRMKTNDWNTNPEGK